MKRLNPFAKNIDRLEEHMKNVNLYLDSKVQTCTLSDEDIDSMLRFIEVVGNNFDYNCRSESWWNKEFFHVLSQDVVDMVNGMRGDTGITEEVIDAKNSRLDTIINALDRDIAIELKSAIEQSYPALMVIFPADKIAI